MTTSERVGVSEPGMTRLAQTLNAAWKEYHALFGEPPHGTVQQFEAMIRLAPQFREYVRLYEKQREEGMTV